MNKNLINDLLGELSMNVLPKEISTLAGGYSGLAIALNNFKYSIGDKKFIEYREKYLYEIIKDVNSKNELDLSLYAGLPGINIGLISMNSDNKLLEYIYEIDSIIIHNLTIFFENYHYDSKNFIYGIYDLFSGLSGTGLYLLKTKELRDTIKTDQLVSKILDILSEPCKMIVVDNDEVPGYFIQKGNMIGNLKKYEPNGGVILGAAHGISSIIYFFKESDNRQLLSNTHKKSVKFLLDYLWKNIDSNGVCAPIKNNRSKNIITPNGSWCFGSLGILLGLSYFDNFSPPENDIQKIILKFINISLDKHTIDNRSKIMCHGTAGLLYFSNYMFLKYNNNDFLEPARRFYSELERIKDLKGYTDTPLSEKKSFECKIGLLEGACGSLLSIDCFEKSKRFKHDWIFGYL